MRSSCRVVMLSTILLACRYAVAVEGSEEATPVASTANSALRGGEAQQQDPTFEIVVNTGEGAPVLCEVRASERVGHIIKGESGCDLSITWPALAKVTFGGEVVEHDTTLEELGIIEEGGATISVAEYTPAQQDRDMRDIFALLELP